MGMDMDTVKKMKHRTLIIAEAGVNHNGSLDIAKQLIDVAANAEADIVKFQSFKSEDLVSKNASKADYQVKNTGNDDGQLEMLRALELTKENCVELKKYCEGRGILFLTTPFSESAAEQINSLVPFWKVPSGEITNLPFLDYLAGTGKPVVLSTGMSTIGEVETAIHTIRKSWGDKPPKEIDVGGFKLAPLSLLHCVSSYPAVPESSNLAAMSTMQQAFNIPVGYSDHTLGIGISIAAVALGAEIIEKHFTLDTKMEGPDHLASLDPVDLKTMVGQIRNVELSIGSGIKVPHETEINTKEVARKSIHLKYDLKKDYIIKENDLVIKRPGNGIQPNCISQLVGRKLKKDLERDTMITWENII